MRKLGIILVSLAATNGACSQAAVPEVTVDQAIAAVRDCAQAAGADGVDEAVLLDLGWQRATAASGDGKPIDLNLTILGKEQDGSPLIMTGKPGSEGNRVCAITGGLDPTLGFDGLLAALAGAFEAIDSKDDDRPFRVGRDFAIAARTGGGNSFRIAVIEPGDN